MVSKHTASLKHAQHYANAILLADQMYEEGGPGIEKGLRYFDDNWKNIELGQKWAAQSALYNEEAATLACEYPERGSHCLYLRQKPAARITWFKTALQIAHERGFELVEGALHGKIGLAYAEMGEFQQAVEHYATRLKIAERFNDLEGLGEGACNLGILYDSLDMLEAAQECYQYALELADKTSNKKIFEVVTGNLGLIYLKQEKFSVAMEYFERHLHLSQQNGDSWSESNALTNLGIACLKLGNLEDALSHFQQSISINQKLGDLDGEAKNLSYIGTTMSNLGRLDDAVTAYQARIHLAQKLNDLRGEAKGNWNLGKVFIEQQKYEFGLEYMKRCTEYEKITGDRAWEEDMKVVKTIEETLAQRKK
jgi:tetratricopeptide (TPR) repeat protein